MRGGVLGDKIGKSVIRRQGLGGDRLHDRIGQALLLLASDRSRKLLRRGQERIFGNRAFALSWYLLKEYPDRHQSVSLSLAEHFHRLFESTRNLVETRDVIFVMPHGIKRHGVRQIGEAVVVALHLRDGHLVILQLVVRNTIIQDVNQEIVRETILFG